MFGGISDSAQPLRGEGRCALDPKQYEYFYMLNDTVSLNKPITSGNMHSQPRPAATARCCHLANLMELSQKRPSLLKV